MGSGAYPGCTMPALHFEMLCYHPSPILNGQKEEQTSQYWKHYLPIYKISCFNDYFAEKFYESKTDILQMGQLFNYACIKPGKSYNALKYHVQISDVVFLAHLAMPKRAFMIVICRWCRCWLLASASVDSSSLEKFSMPINFYNDITAKELYI